jgi:thioredoxin reductase (NADPH)
VDFKKHPFKLYTSEGTYQARAVILATGASPKFLGVENEKKLIGKGVSTCAICDGWFFKGKHVAVIGGGDTAIREATYLSKLAKDVTVIHRRGELRAQAALQDRARSIPNIKFIWNTHVTGFIGSSRLEALRLENCNTGKIEKLPIDGAFVAIGHEPNTEFLGTALELDKKTYVVLRNRTMTSVEGVFAAGDVADYRYMQAITAAGSGCAAALDANEWLEGKDALKRDSHSH